MHRHSLQKLVGAARIMNLIKHGTVIISQLLRVQLLLIKQIRIDIPVLRQKPLSLLILYDDLMINGASVSGNHSQIPQLLMNRNHVPVINAFHGDLFLKRDPFSLHLIIPGNRHYPVRHMPQINTDLRHFRFFPQIQHQFIFLSLCFQFLKGYRRLTASQPPKSKDPIYYSQQQKEQQILSGGRSFRQDQFPFLLLFRSLFFLIRFLSHQN